MRAFFGMQKLHGYAVDEGRGNSVKPPHEDLYWQDVAAIGHVDIDLHINHRLEPVWDGTAYPTEFRRAGRPYVSGLLDGIDFVPEDRPSTKRCLGLEQWQAFIDVPRLHDAPDSAWLDFAAKLQPYLGEVVLLFPGQWVVAPFDAEVTA